MFEIKPYGDSGLRIQFGNDISVRTHRTVRSFATLLEKEKIAGVLEWIPTYTAISILYDPYVISFADLESALVALQDRWRINQLPKAEVIYIPTCYGGDKGPDLSYVARHNRLTEADVIAIHSETPYLVYMMGFTPGFPYLGGMSKRIATPRLAKPRARIPAGSVGIAGEQTGIYPLQTPGGWQIIGRTPIKLFDPHREVPILPKVGNYLKFCPVSREQYEAIAEEVDKGVYEPRIATYREGELHDATSRPEQ